MAVNTSHTSGGKDLKKILSGYLKFWYLFLIGIIVFGALAFLYIRYKTVPEFEVQSKILVEDKDKGSTTSELESFSEMGLIKSNRNIEDEIGIITSSGMMEKVLKNLSLEVGYEAEGRFGDVDLYAKNLPVNVKIEDSNSIVNNVPVRLQIKNNNEFELRRTDEEDPGTVHQFDEVIEKPYGTFRVIKTKKNPQERLEGDLTFSFLDIQGLANQYVEKLTVESLNERGGLLSISILDAIPERGKDVMTELMKVYEQEGIDYRNRLAMKTIAMIDERLQSLTGELSNVEKNVEQFKQENDLTNVSSDAELYLQQANQYRSELANYETQIAVLNSIENYLKGSGAEDNMVPSSLNIQDPTLVNLISRFNELQSQKRRMLETTPASNPLVVDLQRQLTNLRTNILENLRNIKRGLEITRDNIKSNSYRYQSKISKVPTVERGLTEINRQQSTKQGLYLFLLQKREEEALSIAAPVSNTRIIDDPRATEFPVSPNKTSIYLGAILAGFFVPFAFVYVRERLDDKIQTTDDIAELTDTPVLGQIAHNDTKQNIVATDKNNAPVAELFRLIRFNLKFISAGKANKVILVTSGDKGEGKSFFSSNLGVSLAFSGKKVVILSFDLRAPKLMSYVNLTDDFGITDFLVGDAKKVEDLIVAHPEIQNLSLIGSGPVPPNAGEIMLSDKVGVLIEEVKKQFDYVIIDSAPVGKVADVFALEPYADSTLYIVRSNYSSKDSINEIDKIYQNQKMKRPMIVLNGVKIKDGYGYGYGERKKRK